VIKLAPRITYEFVKLFFEANNYQLLSPEYINCSSKLMYKCDKGHVSSMSFNNFKSGSRCPACANKIRNCSITHSIDFIKKVFEENGCKLLSTNYTNNKTPLDYICSCGNISRTTFNSFARGHRCYDCGIKKKLGANNPNYNPNLSDEERIRKRETTENWYWRKLVYKRDNYTCQKCSKRGSTYLEAHHLFNYSKYKSLRYEVYNGITFCKDCHKEFHFIYGNRNNNFMQVESFIGKEINKDKHWRIICDAFIILESQIIISNPQRYEAALKTAC
jgi:hypothetical protein